jgi:hypothetical protein
MAIYIGIDDTDIIGSRGTGRFAREIAGYIADTCPVSAVTRHQLLVHPDIPYTSHNSCAVIHVDGSGKDIARALFSRVRDIMVDGLINGSDPGLAVADRESVTPGVMAFGKDAKQFVLSQERAIAVAENSNILLEGLGGTNGGIIGALAGIGLVKTGTDGRFLQKGSIRDVTCTCTCEQIYRAGVDEVISLEGKILTDITVEVEKNLKPCLIDGRAILLVEEREGLFHALKRD